jgi:hypothetical protein
MDSFGKFVITASLSVREFLEKAQSINKAFARRWGIPYFYAQWGLPANGPWNIQAYR